MSMFLFLTCVFIVRCCRPRSSETVRSHFSFLTLGLVNSPEVDKGLLDRLNGINNTLTTQWNRLQNIRSTVDKTNELADKSRNRVRDAEDLIDRAREELQKAKDAISKVVRCAAIMLISTLRL